MLLVGRLPIGRRLPTCPTCLLVRLIACFLIIAAHSYLMAASFTVSGVVVNSVTGEPIPHALVQSTGAEQHAVFSGQDGRFQMEGIPQGAVYFIPRKPGFIDPERHLPVKVGADTSLVTIKLAPESSIEGRIVDRDGEAIEGLSVECMMQSIVNGRKMWQMCGMAQSDETGNFHLQNLRPGSYLLRTSAQALFPNANDSLPQQAYAPHFYPDAADLSSVQPMAVRPGETARADFSIAPVPAFRISGAISPAQGGIFGRVQSAEGEQQPGAGIRVDPRTGAWRAPPLPAGSWNVVFESRRGQEFAYHAEQSVNVTSSDVKNVQMALEPMPSIPVNVNSAAAPNQRQVQIQLMPETQSLSNNRMFGSSRSPQNLNESPTVREVPPGTYTVFAVPYGGDCLASISAGGVDLTRNPLVVSAGSQTAPIDVTLEDNCASIQGQVRMDTPAADASVILAPSSGAIQPQLAMLQQDGSFAFNRLSPGDYRLYAVSTAAGLEYGNAEAMRQIDGASVTLTAKQKASVTLNLVTRDAN
jgi:hypothetical protein